MTEREAAPAISPFSAMAEREETPTIPQPSTILIVEDDLNIQALLSDVLTNQGYKTFATASGCAALEIVEQESIDLMLLDVMLPDIDGYEVCRRLREHHLESLPVIMLTAVTQPQRVVEGLLSADDYMPKPFMPGELLVRIQKILRQRQEMLAQAHENATLQDMIGLVQRELAVAHMQTQTESLLRREMLHNVTTHLQSLSAIVEAEIRKLPPGVEREAVQRIRGRVRGAALVYQVSEALGSDPVAIGEIIRMTASALKSIYRPWKRITMTVKGEAVELPAEVAAPLAMVVNELVTNSFKHAFPDNRFGAITIEYERTGDEFCMVVADDGVGLPPEYSSGNGRQTIAQLVQGLQGTVSWQSSTTGTSVTVRLPIASA